MVTIPTKPTIKCKIGYYPVAVVASKAGKPVNGANVKFESWALVLGRKVGPQVATRITSVVGLAEICFLYRMYGKVSIYHANEDFGSGEGKWHTVIDISSLKSSIFKEVKAKVTLPTAPVTPKVPTLPALPTIPIPPIIPTPPTPPVIPDKPIAGLPTGRIGSVTRLSVMNFFNDKPTFVGSAFWGCEGASRNATDIVHVSLDKNMRVKTIERQRSIDVGQTRQFKNGFSVKVTRVVLSGRSTYADVIIAPYKIMPTEPTPITPTPITPTPITPPPVTPDKKYSRITRILSDGQDLPKANKGETVKITAESYCVVDGKIDKSNVPSVLLVDGVISDKKPVVGGIVSYEWEATSTPPRHTICVHINPTEICKAIGRDCKKISVSPSILDPSDQLAKERSSAKEQRDLIKKSRTDLRDEIIRATREAPIYEEPIVPTTPIAAPITISPLVPKPVITPTGSIKLTGLPISVPDDVPAYIYVDNINKGIVSAIPMTLTSIKVGTHSVYIMAGEFKSISKSAEVVADETTIVSLL